jgi:hypothetical protein
VSSGPRSFDGKLCHTSRRNESHDDDVPNSRDGLEARKDGLELGVARCDVAECESEKGHSNISAWLQQDAFGYDSRLTTP